MDEVVRTFLIITLPLLVAFLGILVSALVGYFKLIVPLTKIEEHTRRIPDLADKVVELRLAMERGRLHNSVDVPLPKSGLTAIVSMRDRKDGIITIEIEFGRPIVPEAAEAAIQGTVSGVLISHVVSPYDITLRIEEGNAKKAADRVRSFLRRFDDELSTHKEWEKEFESHLAV